MALYSNLSGHLKQEWEVIKVNQRGKEQPRCIGIDLQYIYNRKRKDDHSSFFSLGGVRRKQRLVKSIRHVDFGLYKRKSDRKRNSSDWTGDAAPDSAEEEDGKLSNKVLRAFFIEDDDNYVQYFAKSPDEAAQILAKIQWVRRNRGEGGVSSASRTSSARSLLLTGSGHTGPMTAHSGAVNTPYARKN